MDYRDCRVSYIAATLIVMFPSRYQRLCYDHLGGSIPAIFFVSRVELPS